MSDHLTSNPSAKELRASAHWFRTREIKLRGYDGMSADICERAADEIERLERCLFQMQEAAKDLASKVKPASGFCEFSDDGNHECKECDIKWPGRPPEATGVLALVKKMRDEYRSFLDKGKGTWPGPDYVQDETWARWQGAWSALDSIASEAERIARVPHEPQPSEARGDDLAGWLEEMHDYARPIDQPKLMQAAALLRSSHEPEGVLALVKQKRDEYRSFLDAGKGTWPGSDYIQDETWARWQGAWSVLDSIVSQAERERPCLFDKLVGNPLDGFPSTKGSAQT